MGQTAFPFESVLDVTPLTILGNNTVSASAAKALTPSQGRALLDVYSTGQTDAFLATKAAASHTHLQSEVTGLATALAAKADLVGGLVPANQLPSYVDDVLEFANLAAFPGTGESGKIYVALDTSRTYRWGGSTYAELTDSTAVWGSISGVLSNQTDLASALSGKSDTGHTHAYASLTGIPSTFTPSAHSHAASDISSGTLDVARIPIGTTASTVCVGNDSRLSDARTPVAHKASHVTGQPDAISPSDIGAVPTARTLTINGTALDLSADRSWTVSGGVSSLNGLTNATQTFQGGTTGTDFGIVSAAGVHTFNMPDASATARGVVTTGTQTFAGAKTFNSSVRVNGTLDFNADSLLTYRLIIGFAAGSSRLTFHSINANGSGWGTANTINGWADGSSWWCKVGGGAWGFGTGVYGYTHGFVSPAANTTRLNGSTNPQVFTVANTYTSETSFELVSIGWASNVCTIGVSAGSAGGSVRALQIVGCQSTSAGLGTAGSVTVSGGVYSGADTAGVNGGSVTVSTAALVSAGASSTGGVFITTGNVSGSRSSNTNNACGSVVITAGSASTSVETTYSGRGTAGGGITLNTGAGGGSSVSGTTARSGGSLSFIGGSGGSNTNVTSGTGGSGGGAAFVSGGGGTGATSGGPGGAFYFNSGDGGSGSGVNSNGGSGGGVFFTSGAGGNGAGTGANGSGGNIQFEAWTAGTGGVTAGVDGRVIFRVGGSTKVQFYSGYIDIQDVATGYNIQFGTTYGSKIGTAANQKLAFWGATPIVQPTTGVASATVASPGAGATIKTDDTFDGYTIAQVVKALRNAGVLA